MRPQKEDHELEISSLSALEHILAHRPSRVRRLQIAGRSKNPRLNQLRDLAKKAGLAIDTSLTSETEPARAWLAPFEYSTLEAVLKKGSESKRSLVLLLDHLQDPQNFGALCRSAEAFGAHGIVLPKDRGATVSPGVYHASVGAVETLPIARVANLGDAARKLKEAGYWVVGTTIGDGAKSPDEMPDFEKIALLLGTEWEGLGPSLTKQCDWLVELPLAGKIQSLNVSVAGGILCYLFTRPKKT